MAERDLPDAVSEDVVGTIAFWREKGISAGKLRALVQRGDLVPLRRGVYATRAAADSGAAGPARGHALRVAAARAVAGPDAVASHHSAALIHGLDLLKRPPGELVTLTRPPARRTRSWTAHGVIFHTAALPEAHVTRAHGTAVTTVARTVIDLARTAPFMEAVIVADHALRSLKTSKRELRSVISACPRWPGIEQARHVVGFSSGLAESVLESAARVVFDAYRLDPPALQVEQWAAGVSYRVDFYWGKYRTVAECDGLMKYSTRADILSQFRRDRVLRDIGNKIVHLTWRELFDTPGLVVGRLRAAFGAGSPY